MALMLLVVGALDVLAGASVVGGALLTALIGGLLNLLLLLLLLLGKAALGAVDLDAVDVVGAGTASSTTGFTSAAVVVDDDDDDDDDEDELDAAPPSIAVPLPESTAAAKALPMPLLPAMVICTRALMTCSLGCVSK